MEEAMIVRGLFRARATDERKGGLGINFRKARVVFVGPSG
jgi:hypothetical protein